MDIYQIRDIDHFYDGKQVLAVENVAIPSGSITGLAGPNGSGKSTFLKLLGFLEKPTYGEILFKGRKALPFSDTVRFSVTLLTQSPYLMHRSVFDNVAYGLRIRDDTREMKDRVYEAMEQVGLLPESFARRRWTSLSGGETQRVALAARLVLKPEVLLMDEPTASVDAHSARLIKNAVLKAREDWGTTIIVVTHDWQWLYETCDSVLHMLHGRIFHAGLGCAVYGPWRLAQKGLLQKELDDGQFLVVPKPEEGKQAAVLDPARMKIALPGKDTLLKWNLNTLNGFVTRLFLEKNGETVQTVVKVGELDFILQLKRQEVEELSLYPGGKVCISYDPQDIEWY